MDREGNFLDTKYPYMVHAEVNAIMNSTASVEGAMLFCTLFPCNECMKIIIQSGIKTVIYLSDKYHDENMTIAARRLGKAAEIDTKSFFLNNEKLEIKI